MKVQLNLLCAAALIADCFATSSAKPSSQRQPSNIKYRVNQERANAVKEAFSFAWDGYYKYAFPNDELRPVTNTSSNSRNGWGATAVDALSTAIVMELDQVVKNITTYVPTINFANSSDIVSLFETTIRYLGGLLAGYDLLTGPFAHLSPNSEAKNALLAQAKSLADDLSFAFKTPSGVPDNEIFVNNQSLGGADTNGLATIGTLVLEWTHLSDLTGDPKYANLTQKAEAYLLNPEPPVSQPFPGLVGTNVFLSNGTFADSYGGWVGGDDSFYEYLIKMFVYDSERFGSYKDRWIAAADSTIKYLASHPSTRPDLTFLAQYNGQKLIYEAEHLGCFSGGNFLLGGLVLGEQKYIDFGLSLTASCYQTYTATATGIGPEIFAWLPSTCNDNSTSCTGAFDTVAGASNFSSSELDAGNSTAPFQTPSSTASRSSFSPYPPGDPTAANPTSTSACHLSSSCAIPSQYEDQADFYKLSGFWLTNRVYDLRPEVIESIYYAYRITGDPMYQDWAWDAFVAINRTSRVGSGFSMISNVNVQGGGGYADNQESFFFAELMKYAYLIHAPDGPWQVNYNGKNEYVFNTEAHPFKIAGQALR